METRPFKLVTGMPQTIRPFYKVVDLKERVTRGGSSSPAAATFQDSPVLGNLVLRPLPNADCIPTGTGVRGSDNATPRNPPRALQKVHQA